MKYCTFPKEVYLAFSRSEPRPATSWPPALAAVFVIGTLRAQERWVSSREWVGSRSLGVEVGLGLGGDWCLVTAGGTDSRWREKCKMKFCGLGELQAEGR